MHTSHFSIRRGAWLLTALLALTIIPLTSAAEDTEFTLARFLEVPTLGGPIVSPDGEQVVWTTSRRNLEDDKRITRLWIGDVDKNETRQLTFIDAGTGARAWRPDGALSFVRTHDDAPQVWINPLDGSEPRPVTDVEGGVGAYWWSPDGKYLAILADPAEEEEAEEEDTGDEDADPLAAQIYEVPEDRQDWEVRDRLEHPEEFQQVWIVAVGQNGPNTEEEPRQLTNSPWNPQHIAWSPDGKTLAVTFNPRFSGLVDEDQQIALVSVETGEAEVISATDRHSSLAAFSPDGKKLAYYTDRDAEYRAYLNLKDIVVRDLASGETVAVTRETQITLGGSGSTPGRAPIWDKDNRHLYVTAADGANLDLYKVDTRKNTLEQLTDLEGNMDGMSLAGGTLAYLESSLDKPGSLFVGQPGKKMKEMATVNDAVASYNLAPAQLVRLPGHEGGFVEGFLFLPPGAGMDEKLPAIIEMHGGPFYRYGNAWTTRYPWQVLAQQGFAVLIVNPRGGTGYGDEFLRGVHRNFGTDDFEDIMAAIDDLVDRGVIDGDRLGFTGYSYGGLMTNVVVSRTDRFKAAVSIAGIWNYVSAMGQNNPQLFIDSYDQPWDGDLQRMWEHSPASRANKVVTPTLIMHGTEDHPVDPRQSIEMFSYLQLNGIPSRLVLYPDEGHGINKPSHMIDYQTRELQWFRHYVLGEEDATGAEDPVPVEE
jgi:dipeptidyl aminopeptidase/acylaminoacyl peptidase